MNDEDINTIMAIALEDPDRIEVMATSTPSGRRSHFYRWCMGAGGTRGQVGPNGWAQFHFPSSVNPTWSAQVEQEFRNSLSELAYIHEIEAEFGEEAAGVYPKKYLDASYAFAEQMGYLEYPLSAYPAQGPRAMGIDWDVSQATPNLCIVEWWPEWQRFRVAYREQLPKTKFTLDYAVNRIIQLQMQWQCDYVVADRGMGEFQVETLQKYGLEHPESFLKGRVYGHHLSDKIEVRDPYTKQLVKKAIKPFMVNCSVVALERGQLVLCPGDKPMRKQLEEYHIVRVSQSGDPVYSSENEHAIDAMNLALLYLNLRHNDLFRTNFTSTVRLIQPKEQREMRPTLPQAIKPKLRSIRGGQYAPLQVPRRAPRRANPEHFRTLF